MSSPREGKGVRTVWRIERGCYRTLGCIFLILMTLVAAVSFVMIYFFPLYFKRLCFMHAGRRTYTLTYLASFYTLKIREEEEEKKARYLLRLLRSIASYSCGSS